MDKAGNFNQQFVKFQETTLSYLGYFGVTRHSILKDKNRKYFISTVAPLAQLCYYCTVVNSLVKLLYIFYLLYDKFELMDFLDKMAALLYLLILGIMLISNCVWLQRYPLFEILYRFWEIQQRIFAKLGNPLYVKEAIDEQQKATVWVHQVITWIGCICFIIQYYADPKYYTFSYAVISGESWFLWTIFGAHEFIFMSHAWSMMTAANSLFTFVGISLFSLLDCMTKSVDHLTLNTPETKKLQLKCHRNISKKREHEKNNSVKISVVTQESSYEDIKEILSDYKELTLINELYNRCVSYTVVFLHACGYFQFIADVFLAVQVLRLPQTGVMDIWFYIEDSLASMYMIYRVYNNISRVEPASKNFFLAVQHFLQHSSRERKYIIKATKALKLVSMKLGPCPVTRKTVLSAMEILGDYYICVALW